MVLRSVRCQVRARADFWPQWLIIARYARVNAQVFTVAATCVQYYATRRQALEKSFNEWPSSVPRPTKVLGDQIIYLVHMRLLKIQCGWLHCSHGCVGSPPRCNPGVRVRSQAEQRSASRTTITGLHFSGTALHELSVISIYFDWTRFRDL